MGRIRSAKPDWWTDAKMCALSRDVRFTYKGLIEVMADDEGRFLADPRLVKGQVWPLDDDITPKRIEAYLAELVAAKRIVLYEVEGAKYGYIPTFLAHQKISHPTESKLPAPPEPPTQGRGEIPAPLPNNSGNAPEVLRPDVDLDVDVDSDVDVDGIPRSSLGVVPEPDRPPLAIPAVRPPPRKKGAPLEMTDDEAAVMAHYKTRHLKRRPERDTKGVARMREALTDYSVAELCQAIDGNADDPWHRQRGKHEMLYVFRADLIDGFIAAKAQRDEDDIPLRLKDPARAYVWGVAGVERPA